MNSALFGQDYDQCPHCQQMIYCSAFDSHVTKHKAQPVPEMYCPECEQPNQFGEQCDACLRKANIEDLVMRGE